MGRYRSRTGGSSVGVRGRGVTVSSLRVIMVVVVVVAGLACQAVMGRPVDCDGGSGNPGGSVGSSTEAAPDVVDLRYVPRGAAGFLALRPAAVLRRQEFGGIARIAGFLGRLADPEGRLGLAVEKIGQVTWALPGRVDQPPGPPVGRTVILQMVERCDFHGLISQMMPQAIPGEIQGRTCYTGQRGEGLFIVCPDDRTLVASDRMGTLEEILAREGEHLPEFLDATTWDSFCGDHIVAAVDRTAVSSLVLWPGVPFVAAIPLSPFGEIWYEHPTVMGLRLGDQTRLHAATIPRSGAGAAVVLQEYLQAHKRARLLSEELKAGVQGVELFEAEILSALLEDYDRLLTDMRIRVKGDVVRAEAFAGVEAVQRYTGILEKELRETGHRFRNLFRNPRAPRRADLRPRPGSKGEEER